MLQSRDRWQVVGSINGRHFCLPFDGLPGTAIMSKEWNHLAVSSRLTYAVRFESARDNHLEIDKSASFSDGTLCISFCVDQLSSQQIMITKGSEPLGPDGQTNCRSNPMELTVCSDGSLRFACVDDTGRYVSTACSRLSPFSLFYRIDLSSLRPSIASTRMFPPGWS